MSPIYVFTPAGNTAKRVFCGTMLVVGAVGFLGNCCIFYFLGQKPKRGLMQSNPFVTNLNLYIRGLSLSDLLSLAVSLPLACVQITFDVFQTGWACRIVRYANFIFPAITSNTLVVISLEKYLATRKILRTVRTSKMRKWIIFAWVFGIAVMLLPAATYDGERVDLNNTHFTIICKNNEQFYPFRITLIILPIQYVLPSIFVTYVNICLMKTVWDSGRRQVANVARSTFQAHLRAKKVKGTTLLIALTFAFIIPFFFFFGNVAYTQIAKPKRDFATDYMMRYFTGGLVFLSGLLNLIIYCIQVKDFRVFLINLLCRRNSKLHQPELVRSDKGTIFKAKVRDSVAGMHTDDAIELRQFKLDVM